MFPSDSLVPADDASVLFTGAGMNQFKPYFLGLKKDLKRATSCQKCLRTADLDRVGKTAYHHTFFEMLGNFSFGDYFKEEAIAWAWEFVTKEIRLPKSKLWVSTYQEDEEAFKIWKTKIGLPESRILRMGAHDNFWPANAKEEGPNGPCGPCSEIYVGEVPGKGVEIWNLVFTQHDRQSDGTLKDLPQKNIDTGMGLERTASVLQGVASNFDIDLFQEIRVELRKLLIGSSRESAHENAVMDHARAVVFSIADGVSPSNEGRGYVIRKLIRLGSEHLEKAGAANSGLFHQMVPAVVRVMSSAYPELAALEKNISMIVLNEENAYREALLNIPRMKKEILELSLRGKNPEETSRLAAEIVFKYYDTHGIPFDTCTLTVEKAGLVLDGKIYKEEFEAYLAEQKKRSRQASKISGEIFAKNDAYALLEGLPDSKFLGYEKLEAAGQLLRVIKNGAIETGLTKGEEGLLIFDKTSFYAEAGGQVGDAGEISGNGSKATVTDAVWMEKCIAHKVRVESGELRSGESYTLKVDGERRSDIMKNHTATHLLHSALRKVLGDHVKQSGSLVAPDRLRFDFTHFGPVDAEKIAEVEGLVNREIQKNAALTKKVVGKEEAVREGAIAFFGEKYGDEVRVVTIGDFSKELCGGTHLTSTGEIQAFKIISEGSIQAGVRRIEAVTGRGAREFLEKNKWELAEIQKLFKIENREDLPAELKKIGSKIAALKSKLANSIDAKMRIRTEEVISKSEMIKGIKIVYLETPNADIDTIRRDWEYLKSKNENAVTLFQSDFEDKFNYIVAASGEAARNKFQSDRIIKLINEAVQGSGGGRPDFAVGGGKILENKIKVKEVGLRVIKSELAK